MNGVFVSGQERAWQKVRGRDGVYIWDPTCVMHLINQLQQVNKRPLVSLWLGSGFYGQLEFWASRKTIYQMFSIHTFHIWVIMELIELSSGMEVVLGIDESNAGHA